MGNYIWLIAAVVLLAAEAMTAGLTTIWFAVGALAAWLTSVLGAGLGWQVFVFLLASLALLALTRPLAEKLAGRKTVKTNTDSVIGRRAVVTAPVDNLAATGEITLDGMPWSARSSDEKAVLPVGTEVTILEVRGVKCIVKPINKEETLC